MLRRASFSAKGEDEVCPLGPGVRPMNLEILARALREFPAEEGGFIRILRAAFFNKDGSYKRRTPTIDLMDVLDALFKPYPGASEQANAVLLTAQAIFKGYLVGLKRDVIGNTGLQTLLPSTMLGRQLRLHTINRNDHPELTAGNPKEEEHIHMFREMKKLDPRLGLNTNDPADRLRANVSFMPAENIPKLSQLKELHDRYTRLIRDALENYKLRLFELNYLSLGLYSLRNAPTLHRIAELQEDIAQIMHKADVIRSDLIFKYQELMGLIDDIYGKYEIYPRIKSVADQLKEDVEREQEKSDEEYSKIEGRVMRAKDYLSSIAANVRARQPKNTVVPPVAMAVPLAAAPANNNSEEEESVTKPSKKPRKGMWGYRKGPKSRAANRGAV
jgi:hypothetical protein